MPFDKLPGPFLIDLHMMEAMGMVEIGLNGVPILISEQPQQQARQDEEEEKGDLQQVMHRLDTLDVRPTTRGLK